MIKDEREGKTITTFATTAPERYGYRIQKDDYEIESSEFIKAKWVKKYASKELTFHDFDRCVQGVINKCIIKEQVNFRSFNNKTYSVTSNIVAVPNPNENGREFQDDDKK